MTTEPVAAPSAVTKLVTRVLIPIVVVALSAVCAALLVFARPVADRGEPARVAPLVEVLEVHPQQRVVQVEATGVARAARQVSVLPEVSGRVVEVSERLVPGGRFAKGDVLVRIDPREYQLAVDQEAGRVRQAELEVELEQGRQQIARREWELLGGGRPDEAAPLALRDPQLATVRQQLEASRSTLQRARLSLERTVIRAPFDAVVISDGVHLGQVVGPQTQIASLVGTDELWVRISVPVEHLSMIPLPDGAGNGGASVRVTQRLGAGATVVRDGRVARLMGELDPQTRTAQLLVSVAHPFAGDLPLLPGAYVEVEILGRTLADTYSVPRPALDGRDAVWIVDAADTLHRREITVGWRTDTEVIVTDGLSPGDRVVVTPLSLPMQGMLVRPITSPERSGRAGLPPSAAASDAETL